MSFLSSRTPPRVRASQPVRRREDARLLVGQGRYSDDVRLTGQVYGSPVRSPHADARVQGIETTAALEVPGMIAVLTVTMPPPMVSSRFHIDRCRRILTTFPWAAASPRRLL